MPTQLLKATEIAFPLIGFGQLKYPPGTAADEGLQAVIDYLNTPALLGGLQYWNTPPRRLTDLHFIVSPGGGRGAIEEQIAWQNAWR